MFHPLFSAIAYWPLATAILACVTTAHADLVCATSAPSSRPSQIAKPAAGRPLEASGRHHALVIFAKFAGEAPAVSAPPPHASQLFDAERPGSLSHYYQTMSDGRFRMDGTILPRRYESSSPASYYLSRSEEAGDYARFVREILDKVDRDIDFSTYDNDGPDQIPNSGDDDGWVDYVFVIARSTPAGFIIGNATGIAGLGLPGSYATRDVSIQGTPIRIGTDRHGGSLNGEGSFTQLVGTMAHEFGHALGLPDLYDLAHEDQAHDSAGIGRWGLMGWGAHGWDGSDGPNELSAWCLEELGWLSPELGNLLEASADTTLTISDIRGGGRVLRVPLPTKTFQDIEVAEDYLLLEYRSRAHRYYGRGMPAAGLLVWHVRPYQPDNTDETRKLVDLVSADGLYAQGGDLVGDHLDAWAHDAEYQMWNAGNLGDATDPFDGHRFTSLGMATNPSVDPGREFSQAVRGPQLQLARQGDAMSVDLRQSRWSGIISGDIHWTRRVIVDGDLTVAPSGRLTIHRGAEVLLDRDRNGTGRDSARVEIVILGDLKLQPAAQSIPSPRFRALRPGGSWYGIVLSPALDSWVFAPVGSYEVSDSRYGIFTPAPARLRLIWEGGPTNVLFGGAPLPQVEVWNDGGAPSDLSTIAIHILLNGKQVATHRVVVGPLAMGESRLLSLQHRLPIQPGTYTLNASLVDMLGRTSPAPPSRQIEIIEHRNPFTAIDLGDPITRGNGAGFLDIDSDGDLDVYLARYDKPNLLFCNNDLTFSDCGEPRGLRIDGPSRSYAVGDPDGDDDLDLYLVSEGPNALLLNDGRGLFSTKGSPILADTGKGHGASFLDVDGDGDLDLFLLNGSGPNRLYLQNAHGWTESALARGLTASGHGRGLALSDVDADGDVDLFLANFDGSSQLLQNTKGYFADVTARWGIQGRHGDVAAVFGDHDGDGFVDLFLSNQERNGVLYENGGDSFTAADETFGHHTVGAAFVDYDNDGDLDLATTSLDHLSGGDQLYQNQSPGFVAVGGLLGLREESAGRGLSFADYDDDGDQDILVADMQSSQLYRNNNSEGAWLQIDLVGSTSNLQAIGARVELLSEGHSQIRDVQNAYGYGSHHPATIHFGLDRALRAERVEVQWPNGSRSLHDNVLANRRWILHHPNALTAVVQDAPSTATRFSLARPFPNPFNAGVTIDFHVDAANDVTLEVFSANGQLIRGLVSRHLVAGHHTARWDGTDHVGRSVASGVYLLRLTTPAGIAHRRLVLIK